MLVKRYSKIDPKECANATFAMEYYLKNGYVRMPDYAKIEIRKFMDAMNSMELEYNMRHRYFIQESIEKLGKIKIGVYEFTAPNFIDDRK